MILWLGLGTVRETKRSCRMSIRVLGRHGSRYPSTSAGSSCVLSLENSAAVHEVDHCPVRKRNGSVHFTFGSQEVCADTNLDDVGIGSSASPSSLRAFERLDTIFCVSNTACDAGWQEGIDRQHLKNLHRRKCHAAYLCWTCNVEGKCHIQSSELRFLSKHPRGLYSVSCYPRRYSNKDGSLWR